MIAGLEGSDADTDFVDDADAFMSKNAPRGGFRKVALQNMQISATDRRLGKLDESIGRRGDLRNRTILQGLLSRSLIHKSFHGSSFHGSSPNDDGNGAATPERFPACAG